MAATVIDVGQGDSILVDFPNGQHMLVDAGTREAGPTVVRFLHSHQITRLDYLMASHPHEDHIGGMVDVLRAFSVGKVWDSGFIQGSHVQRDFYTAVKEKGIRFGMPKAGFTEKIGNATAQVLAPGKTLLTGTESDANNNSLVLRISYGKTSLLLSGDMEKEERDTVGAWPKTTVLKVAHHGSRNGTDAAFLRALAPRIAVISVAAQNDYGHPHPEALQALQAARCEIHRTSTEGNIRITLDGNVARVTAQRTAAETPAPAAPTAAPKPAGGQETYIGNTSSHVFHRASCTGLPAEKHRISFTSRDEAIAQGYRPCRNCRP